MDAECTRQIGISLEECLLQRNAGGQLAAALRQTVLGLSDAAISISTLLGNGPLAGPLDRATGEINSDGDTQKELDIVAHDFVVAELKKTQTAFLASEEEDEILVLDPQGCLAVAVDPLDGSSNIDANVSIGTIFSIFPAVPDGAEASLLRPGNEQIAAGYFIYGPNTSLVMTTGHGTQHYVLDRASNSFLLASTEIQIPSTTVEFAINASNYRHWLPPVRNFIDDCLDGAEGPRNKNFNMRWVASLVADAHRILSRGGIFLYPADDRRGYESGRLRLLYEAFPLAMVIEQAGGEAIDGELPILNKTPSDLHQRTPLMFGSSQKVDLVKSYHTDPEFERLPSPLFNKRGLFRV